MGSLLRVIRELLHEAARDLAPTLIVVVIFQAFFIQRMPDSPAALIGGFAVVLLGLALFVKGLDAAIFPAGETMAFDFARRGSFLWLMLFAFCISFASVAAEPSCITTTWSARVARSSTRWVEISTTARSAAAEMASRRPRRCAGSRPTVGSSRAGCP